jgi:hypothetical protein
MELISEKIKFKIDRFYAIGSPISYFLTLRGETELCDGLKLNCNNFFNIFNQVYFKC